ncbi:MAG: hypothetical protein HC769_34925 [Cyanobacteria bacterium CRU_2_1]|nr:hypothetical protein [Cyanobacteria bacterium RU_5_0]NJR63521.1 hypothetical protein [Cyanobacteria bacterium CRU_2_1]
MDYIRLKERDIAAGNALAVNAVLFRPEPDILRIELFPGEDGLGDRSVYIENDGCVRIFQL